MQGVAPKGGQGTAAMPQDLIQTLNKSLRERSASVTRR